MKCLVCGKEIPPGYEMSVNHKALCPEHAKDEENIKRLVSEGLAPLKAMFDALDEVFVSIREERRRDAGTESV